MDQRVLEGLDVPELVNIRVGLGRTGDQTALLFLP